RLEAVGRDIGGSRALELAPGTYSTELSEDRRRLPAEGGRQKPTSSMKTYVNGACDPHAMLETRTSVMKLIQSVKRRMGNEDKKNNGNSSTNNSPAPATAANAAADSTSSTMASTSSPK
ncbi:hypothetical protein FOZ62_011248, partial [Perkinsus olseni]